MIQQRHRGEQHLFQRRHGGAPRGLRRATLGGDFGKLFLGQGHKAGLGFDGAGGKRAKRAKEASGSFLKKRTKKLFVPGPGPVSCVTHRRQIREIKSFLLLFCNCPGRGVTEQKMN
jgi:hypothetical protein